MKTTTFWIRNEISPSISEEIFRNRMGRVGGERIGRLLSYDKSN